jgi:hypothetical protein
MERYDLAREIWQEWNSLEDDAQLLNFLRYFFDVETGLAEELERVIEVAPIEALREAFDSYKEARYATAYHS